ncbi:AC146 [Trabala vishnou gigantina nucleopolyhedrovirus]|uniref:AC146 n=1 Tax=Trabala vishnou gigantina nucleopolyhedrovirus TaxID=2863583 RepID=UPI002481B92B|nr:AC146 [Trabala vishnou gigantina nucleopolyhedrovirus]QYC92727.1 AC146 [Trabala vishnou gigantina nucleopolyhedrovirus]
MNINLYWLNNQEGGGDNDVDDDKLITFSVINTINSITFFLFYYKITTAADNTIMTHVMHTKLVSGLEKFNPIQCEMSTINDVGTANDYNGGTDSDDHEDGGGGGEGGGGGGGGYVLSCLRLPYISMSLINLNNFTVPLCVCIVQVLDEIQVWHIIDVHKRTQPPRNIAKILGVIIQESGGKDVFYKLEKISIKGNVPAALIVALTKQDGNQCKDPTVLSILYPNIKINNENAMLIFK